MKKVIASVFAVVMVFGLMFAIGADDASAYSRFDDVVPGGNEANCATCHTEGVPFGQIMDHTPFVGQSCGSCHAEYASEPAPAPAPEPKPEPAPAPEPKEEQPKQETTAPAAPAAPRPAVVWQNVDFTAAGYTETFRVANYQNHVYIKVRDLVDLAGRYLTINDFGWNAANRTVYLQTQANSGILYADKGLVEVNGVEFNFDKKPRFFNNHIYVPVRAYVEGAGGTVIWNPSKMAIEISSPFF